MSSHTGNRDRSLKLTASAACIAAVLAGAGPVFAQDATTHADGAPGGEIIVTASRRSESVAKLPFNISAYGGDQLKQGNITSVTALTQQVPNFQIQDGGARAAAASIPIIRGLNASTQSSLSARYFQSPVGFYSDNAPITGNFPLFDVDRVEVLRGPQGTLYGAGSLSGAVRIVPTKPDTSGISGYVTGSGGLISHSDDKNYSVGGAVNLPLGSDFAIRISGRHEYEGGFIDQFDIFKRENDDYRSGKPLLADPADVANSPAVFFNKKDANIARTTSFRLAALWKPSDATKVELSYTHAFTKGNGGPLDNSYFAGGSFPIDPRQTIGATGEYERSLPMLEPFNRRTQLASLDISHDLGFATLSTTVALGHTKAQSVADQTVALLGTGYGVYYTGSPANPRAVVPVENRDKDRNLSEEIRLVSNGTGPVSFIAGLYFQQEHKNVDVFVLAPGAGEQSAAAHDGSLVPMALGGTYVLTEADGVSYSQFTDQQFRDYSAYGEISWQATDKLKLTGGARVFHQTFRQRFQGYSTFFFFGLDELQKSSVTSQIFKASASYQLGDRMQTYFTWSQGFRRGGANSFPLSGPVLEPASLLVYTPDKTNNFELGVKGNLGSIFIAADVFYINWKNPQIDLLTPYNLTNAVINGSEATSKGFEIEASGPLGDTGLSFNAGLAYAHSRLSKDFGLPAGDGLGGIVPNAIQGRKGDRVPGAPDWSGSFTLSYKADVGTKQKVGASVGVDFRSSILNGLESASASRPTRPAPAYAMLRASLSYSLDDWTVELYGTNLADKHVIIARAQRSASSFTRLGDWGESDIVARPREVGLRLTRAF